jgi:hypothetical protein
VIHLLKVTSRHRMVLQDKCMRTLYVRAGDLKFGESTRRIKQRTLIATVVTVTLLLPLERGERGFIVSTFELQCACLLLCC